VNWLLSIHRDRDRLRGGDLSKKSGMPSSRLSNDLFLSVWLISSPYRGNAKVTFVDFVAGLRVQVEADELEMNSQSEHSCFIDALFDSIIANQISLLRVQNFAEIESDDADSFVEGQVVIDDV